MQKVILLSGFFMSFFLGTAQVSESFDGWTDASYGTTSSYMGLGGEWESNNAICSSTNARSGNAVRLNDDSGQNEYLLYTGGDGDGKDNGIGTISFYYRHWDADGSNVEFQVQYNQNGGGWTNIGSAVTVTSTTYAQFSNAISLSGDNILVRVMMVQDEERMMIDDFVMTDLSVTNVDLAMGDFAILGVNANNAACSGTTAEDEISFVCFQDLTNSTTLIFNDNGWERSNANQWGDTEGVVRATRSGGTIAAGTVITFRMDNAGGYTSVMPDASWTFSEINGGANFNLNNGGDQIWFCQGDTWDNNGGIGGHDATYTGDVLFGFNTQTTWAADGTTQQSNLYTSMSCFSMAPTGSSDFNKYTGPTTTASKRTWVLRISDSDNWTSYASCADYNSTGPDYVGGYNLDLSSASFSLGTWVGDKDTDWFDCANWQSLSVPTATVSVTVPSSGVTNQPTIGSDGALALDLNLESTSTLTINSTGTLAIYDDFVNNGTLSHTAGTVSLLGTTSQTISGTSSISFYNLTINNTSTGITLSREVSVSNALTLTDGIVSTSSNRLVLTNTTAGNLSGVSTASFINGNLRRYVASNTSTYLFPVGLGTSSTDYHPADIVNNSLTGVTYIDCSVAAISETGNNIDSRVSTSQNGSDFDFIAEAAEWDFTPNTSPTSGSYGVKLYTVNFSGLTDNKFAPVKRTSASTDYADWDSFDGSTTIPASGAAGRIDAGGTGYAQRLGYTSFSKHAIALSAVALPLPVDLTAFWATPEQGQVHLHWETASEYHSLSFRLERSPNGINYKTIDYTLTKYPNGGAYYFLDKTPHDQLSYYRLVQTDYDGKTETFPAIVVRSNLGDAKGITARIVDGNLQLVNASARPIDCTVVDYSGRVVIAKMIGPGEEVNQRLPAKGIYLIKSSGAPAQKIFF